MKLAEIKNKLGTAITNPDDGKEAINIDGNIAAAFSEKGYEDGKISLTQARDLERFRLIDADSSSSPELKKVAERGIYRIISDIKANTQNFEAYTSVQEELAKAESLTG